MAAKYKKIDPRMWNDEKFRTLTSEEKLIAIYAITAQSNRIGLFVFSISRGAEDLGMEIETFRERFGNVCRTLFWVWNESIRTLYLPTWWKYNRPDNPNDLTGCLKDVHDLPETPLLKLFWANSTYLSGKVKERFRTFAKRFWNVSRQEHEQEHEQEQDKSPLTPQRGDGESSPKKKKPRERSMDEQGGCEYQLDRMREAGIIADESEAKK